MKKDLKIKKNFKQYVKEVFLALKKNEMNYLPANIAFFLMLSLVPTIMIIILILSYFNLSIDLVVDLINNVMPTQVADTLNSVLSGNGFDISIGFWTIVALFAGSNGTYSIILASNVLYNAKTNEVIRDRIKSMILLIMIVLLFVFILIVPVFGSNILDLLKNIELLKPIISRIIEIFNIVKWPLTIIIIYFTVKLIYTISPNKKILSANTTLGAITTTILWSLSTAIFSYYLEYFATYDLLYGPLSSIIVLMIWIYTLSYIFVLGIAINTVRYKNE